MEIWPDERLIDLYSSVWTIPYYTVRPDYVIDGPPGLAIR